MKRQLFIQLVKLLGTAFLVTILLVAVTLIDVAKFLISYAQKQLSAPRVKTTTKEPQTEYVLAKVKQNFEYSSMRPFSYPLPFKFSGFVKELLPKDWVGELGIRELKSLAKNFGVHKYSRYNKGELIKLLKLE
jgi:hypothetical protein